jgi:hypothetical protein
MVAKKIAVSAEDRVVLEGIVRARKCQRRMLERAWIVLLAAEGLSAPAIAARVGCSEKLVKRWRSRYERGGIDALKDAPRSGAPLTGSFRLLGPDLAVFAGNPTCKTWKM